MLHEYKILLDQLFPWCFGLIVIFLIKRTDILIFIYIHDNVPKNLYIISQHSKSLVVEGKGGLAQFQAMAMNLSMTLHNCSTRAAIITPARNIAIFKRDFRRNFRHSFKTLANQSSFETPSRENFHRKERASETRE